MGHREQSIAENGEWKPENGPIKLPARIVYSEYHIQEDSPCPVLFALCRLTSCI